jgi:hypothetical protein
MKVMLVSDVTGTRNGVPWPPRGSTVELPDDEALIMVENGLARALKDDDDPEKAVLMPDQVEDAALKAVQARMDDDRRPVLDHDRDVMGTIDTSHATQVLRDAETGEPIEDDNDSSGPMTTKTGPARKTSKSPPK